MAQHAGALTDFYFGLYLLFFLILMFKKEVVFFLCLNKDIFTVCVLFYFKCIYIHQCPKGYFSFILNFFLNFNTYFLF